MSDAITPHLEVFSGSFDSYVMNSYVHYARSCNEKSSYILTKSLCQSEYILRYSLTLLELNLNIIYHIEILNVTQFSVCR